MAALTNIKAREIHINIWIVVSKLPRLQNCVIKSNNINIIFHIEAYDISYK